MKKIKCLIIIIAILIALLLLAIIVLNNYGTKNEKDKMSEGNTIVDRTDNISETDITIEPVNQSVLDRIPKDIEIEPLTDALYYFVIKNCMQNYIDTINIESSIYYGYNDDGAYSKIIQESEIKENIIKLLSDNYIKENNITLDNLYEKIDISKEKEVFVPLEIVKNTKADKIKQYAVHGLIEDYEDYRLKKHIYAIVNIDDTNLTYSIELINSFNEINFDESEENIISNEKNEYIYQTIKDEDFSKEYILSYKRLSIGAPEIMYEKLDKEYRNKKFGSLDNFKQYVSENYDKIYSTTVEKYLVEENKGYKQYVILDKDNNYYIFQEKTPMNDYSVILDTYTVDLPQFLEKYNKADEEERANLNISRFFDAIKTSDYKYAYSKLENEFKEEKFSTLKEFEEYAKKTLVYDDIRFYTFKEKDGIYTYDIEIKKNVDIIEKVFTIKFLEGTDYRLSFNI